MKSYGELIFPWQQLSFVVLQVVSIVQWLINKGALHGLTPCSDPTGIVACGDVLFMSLKIICGAA